MFAFIQIEDRNISPIEIQCNPDWKMSQVLEKFKNKANSDTTPLDLNDFNFFYNGKKVNKELTISQIKNNQSGSSIFLTAKKRTKIMKCPICISNTCFIRIENYGIKFSGCRYNHVVTKTFGDYENSQKINYSLIKCDKCGKTQKELLAEFYKCSKCSEEFKRSSYFCNECIRNHAAGDGQNHKPIKYDDKYYICSKHDRGFISYCKKCKYDLCDICEKNHKDKTHEIIKYDLITPVVINNIKKQLEEIKQKTVRAKSHIDQIKRMFDDAVKALENYYEIVQDILSKYESYNTTLKNYHVIHTVNSLPSSNKKIIEELDKISISDVSKECYLSKCQILIDIFTSDIEQYIGGTAVENRNNQRERVQAPNDKKSENSIENNNIETKSNTSNNESNNDNQMIQTPSKKKIKNNKGA